MPLAASGDEAALEEPGLVSVPTSGSWDCSAEAGTISRVGPGSEPRSELADPCAAALAAPSKEARGASGPAALTGAAVAAGRSARTAAIDPAVRPTPSPGPTGRRGRPRPPPPRQGAVVARPRRERSPPASPGRRRSPAR